MASSTPIPCLNRTRGDEPHHCGHLSMTYSRPHQLANPSLSISCRHLDCALSKLYQSSAFTASPRRLLVEISDGPPADHAGHTPAEWLPLAQQLAEYISSLPNLEFLALDVVLLRFAQERETFFETLGQLPQLRQLRACAEANPIISYCPNLISLEGVPMANRTYFPERNFLNFVNDLPQLQRLHMTAVNSPQALEEIINALPAPLELAGPCYLRHPRYPHPWLPGHVHRASVFKKARYTGFEIAATIQCHSQTSG